MICYLDMDGVLCDFVRGAMTLHGVTMPYDDVRWDFYKQLGIADNDFWGKMDRDFWANLPWTPEGYSLLRGLENFYGKENIVLLTAVALPTADMNAAAIAGKLDWIYKNLPLAYNNSYFVGSKKHMLASRGKVLIDDSDKNVKAFCAAGGQTILIPRPWNAKSKAAFAHRECFPGGSDYSVGEIIYKCQRNDYEEYD
jgi:hypothetical protein